VIRNTDIHVRRATRMWVKRWHSHVDHTRPALTSLNIQSELG
jgi:hypothetical protein